MNDNLNNNDTKWLICLDEEGEEEELMMFPSTHSNTLSTLTVFSSPSSNSDLKKHFFFIFSTLYNELRSNIDKTKNIMKFSNNVIIKIILVIFWYFAWIKKAIHAAKVY